MSALQKNMCTDRRDFLRLSAGIAGTMLLGGQFSFAATGEVEAIQQRQDVPELIQRLKRMTAGVVPIKDDERKARIGQKRSA